MVGNPALHVSSLPTYFFSSLIILPRNPSSSIPLPIRRQTQINRIRVTSADSGHGQRPSSSSSEAKKPLSALSNIPWAIWRQTLRPLSDFGFNGRSIWEGGVGLFLVSGTVLFVLSLAWLRGFQIRSKFRKYTVVLEFAEACGISKGTPVRIRGATVGNVIGVNPSLKSIEAVVEVGDDKTVIPRNSLIKVNQSGLLMETKIEITPREPIPTPSVGPLHQDCTKEGLIVCDREKINSDQGTSLDTLIGIYIRLGRDIEKIGIINSYTMAQRVFSIIEEAKPLLTQIKAMAEDVQPLLAEVRDCGVLKEVENLTQNLIQASDDLRRVHSSVMTPENTELFQKSINTISFTLKNFENISKDIVGFTGDETTKRSLKLLLQNLSRHL
uniref:Mce/MlaD domain-containing protein n=1 Tax=Glycine max TaxID=3847 RepID=A0A0R0G923_SOYBN|eukprot:XP_006595796.2 protein TRIGALACTOSYLDIACYLGLYCEROL 2, chloroplastic [Glycine max]